MEQYVNRLIKDNLNTPTFNNDLFCLLTKHIHIHILFANLKDTSIQ